MPMSRRRVMLINFGTEFARQKDSIAKIVFGLCADTGRYEKIAAAIGDEASSGVFNGVTFCAFHENRLLNRVANKCFRLGAFTWQDLVAKIHRYRPDILHFQNKQALIAPLVKRLDYRPKIVAHYHLFGETLIPRPVDLCVVVSQSMVGYLNKTNPDEKPIRVLHNFIPANVAPLLALPSAIEPAAGRPLRLFYGGGGGRHKGVFDLLQAVDGLPGDFELQLAGRETDRLPGDDRRLQKLGLISGDEYVARLHQADIVVVPSRVETFGLVALEALALGKLLVHTGVDGLAEFASPACTLVVDAAQPASLRAGLAEAMRLVREEPLRLAAMRAESRRLAAHFSLSRAVADLEAMYDGLFD